MASRSLKVWSNKSPSRGKTIFYALISILALIIIFQGAGNFASANLLTSPLNFKDIINQDGSLELAEHNNYWSILQSPIDLAFSENNATFLDSNVQWKIELGQNETRKANCALGFGWPDGLKNYPPKFETIKNLTVELDIKVDSFEVDSDGWARLAAVVEKRNSGVCSYTELDLYDSDQALKFPEGNCSQGGNVVFAGGDVVEIKVAQLSLGVWTHLKLDFQKAINDAWGINDHDEVTLVYLVFERSQGPYAASALLEVKNFLVYSEGEQNIYISATETDEKEILISQENLDNSNNAPSQSLLTEIWNNYRESVAFDTVDPSSLKMHTQSFNEYELNQTQLPGSQSSNPMPISIPSIIAFPSSNSSQIGLQQNIPFREKSDNDNLFKNTFGIVSFGFFSVVCISLVVKNRWRQKIQSRKIEN